MTPETRKFRGEDAKQLIDNLMLKAAFSAVGSHLDAAALSCPPDDKDKAQRIILSKQLLAAIEREIRRVIEDGEVAKVQLSEIEQRRGLKRFLR